MLILGSNVFLLFVYWCSNVCLLAFQCMFIGFCTLYWTRMFSLISQCGLLVFISTLHWTPMFFTNTLYWIPLFFTNTLYCIPMFHTNTLYCRFGSKALIYPLMVTRAYWLLLRLSICLFVICYLLVVVYLSFNDVSCCLFML